MWRRATSAFPAHAQLPVPVTELRPLGSRPSFSVLLCEPGPGLCTTRSASLVCRLWAVTGRRLQGWREKEPASYGCEPHPGKLLSSDSTLEAFRHSQLHRTPSRANTPPALFKVWSQRLGALPSSLGTPASAKQGFLLGRFCSLGSHLHTSKPGLCSLLAFSAS